MKIEKKGAEGDEETSRDVGQVEEGAVTDAQVEHGQE